MLVVRVGCWSSKVTSQLVLHHFGRQFPLNHLKCVSPRCWSKIDTQHNKFAYCVLLASYFEANELQSPAVYSLGPTNIKSQHVQLQLAERKPVKTSLWATDVNIKHNAGVKKRRLIDLDGENYQATTKFRAKDACEERYGTHYRYWEFAKLSSHILAVIYFFCIYIFYSAFQIHTLPASRCFSPCETERKWERSPPSASPT